MRREYYVTAYRTSVASSCKNLGLKVARVSCGFLSRQMPRYQKWTTTTSFYILISLTLFSDDTHLMLLMKHDYINEDRNSHRKYPSNASTWEINNAG
jgi:hypothetical protein